MPRDPVPFTSKASVTHGPLGREITPELPPTCHMEPSSCGVLWWPSNAGVPAQSWPLSHEACVEAYTGAKAHVLTSSPSPCTPTPTWSQPPFEEG